MRDDIRRILREQIEGDKLDGKPIDDIMDKAIEHWRKSAEHWGETENIPMNLYKNVYYKILDIDETENMITYNVLFVDDERHNAFEIVGHGGVKGKYSNELMWDYVDNTDFSFMGGGSPEFTTINYDTLDGWEQLPRTMEFPLSRYQKKVSGMMTDMHTSHMTQHADWKKVTMMLAKKLEESNNKVINLKDKMGIKDKTEERQTAKQLSNIMGSLDRILKDENI